MRQTFPNGMKIRDLKSLVANCPLHDEQGEDFEVWMMTGDGLSSPVMNMSSLNRGDILLGCQQYPS